MTSLIAAAENGNKDIIKILLEHGEDVNHEDKKGYLHNFYVTIFTLLLYKVD